MKKDTTLGKICKELDMPYYDEEFVAIDLETGEIITIKNDTD